MAPVHELDLAEIGRQLITATAIPVQLGHTTPKASIRDYGDHPTPEAEFVRDVLLMRTDELLAKWWAGDRWAVGKWLADRMGY